MPPKQKTPAPIDRPLSRAYLRQFTGWSTAFPPGISDPTSLRVMENVMVTREGAARIRPGLRYLSYMAGDDTLPVDQDVVGTHEPFFLNNGSKAYLFAVRENDDTVGFRVLGNIGAGLRVYELDDLGLEFSIPQGEPALHFSAATSYVKYLQIDNKIFALSNAGEAMRYFTVGSTKSAKRLNSIERPAWNISDKLTVVHPTQAWIASGVPTGVRTNMADNPSFEASTAHWTPVPHTKIERTSDQARVGGNYSGRLGLLPSRVNYVKNPLADGTANMDCWGVGSGLVSSGTLAIDPGTNHMRATLLIGPSGRQYINHAPFLMERAPAIYGYAPALHVDFDIASSFTMNGPGNPGFDVMVRFYDASSVQIGSDTDIGGTVVGGHYHGVIGSVPSGTAYMGIFPVTDFFGIGAGAIGAWWEIWNVSVVFDPAHTGFFWGGSGTDYVWAGAVYNSPSYHAPGIPLRVDYDYQPVAAGFTYAVSVYARAATVAATFHIELDWHDAGYNIIGTTTGSSVADVNSSWATRLEVVGTAPAGAVWVVPRIKSDADIEYGEFHYLDQLLIENALAVGTYFDGSFPDISTELYSWSGTANDSDSTFTEYAAPGAVPTAATPTSSTLDSSTAASNAYSVGFFYTFANEVGESAPSQVTVVKVQRGWSQWKWETANANAEPSGTRTEDPYLCADQLVAYMPLAVFNDALDQGATKWHLYMLTWSDQDPAPVQAVRLATKNLAPGSLHGSHGYLRMTPQQADANAEVSQLPSEVNRFNYSVPSSAGQGLVASDRMVMVFDPAAPAVIRWSSAEMGNYSDFSARKGGGFKTLSSGNLNVPAAVKLWQNPQSADTITILCTGTDGQSTGYYMAPAQVASQSEAVNIMGFEETTATPGTVAPYGCEVVNNALYHPLDEQLMKSTATNYNINHASLTDNIQNMWKALQTKSRIVSSVLDNRIYYLVNNPYGEALEPGCWGNEVWVYDAQAKAGSWSRWLVQGHSLRKFEQAGNVSMSLIRPDGIYYFDDAYTSDDYVTDEGDLGSRPIPWSLETNTQGANRAHDAWAYLQQVGLIVGGFTGSMRYGVRGIDLNGKQVNVSKKLTDNNPVLLDGMPFDLEDMLQVRRTMKEWFFFAGSTVDDEDQLLHSEGQINLVQYRYAPSTVNTGTEFGSIETFEYGVEGTLNASNGIPLPYIDRARP